MPTTSWTAGNGAWTTAGNWSDGVPNGSTAAQIGISSTSLDISVANGSTADGLVIGGPGITSDTVMLSLAGTLTISSVLTVSSSADLITAGGSLDATSYFQVNGGGDYTEDAGEKVSAESLVDNGLATIMGSFDVTGGSLSGSGSLDIDGGQLGSATDLLAISAGHPTITIQDGGTLALNSVTGPAAINFGTPAGGGNDLLTGLVTGTYSNPINNFGSGDLITLLGQTGVSVAAAQISGQNYSVTLTEGSTVLTLSNVTLAAGITGANLHIESTGNGDALVVLCFLAGTRIATPDGEAMVETLRPGDGVVTAEGQVRPVRWVGQSIIRTLGADPLRVAPIRIHAGALGPQCPARDLLVSPDHGILISDVLVHASALVNGVSVTREADLPAEFVYYHVELDTHSVLLAEGAPVESFLDGVEEMGFVNWQDRVPPEDVQELPYPRVKSMRQLPAAIRAQLARTAAALHGEYRLAA